MIQKYLKTICPECGSDVAVVKDTHYSLLGHINGCFLAGKSLDTEARISIYDNTLNADYKGTGRRPYRYQQKGIEFGMQRDAFALFWQMRLGKTITTIKTFQQKGCKKVLVVCPKSVINNWIRELKLEGEEAFRIDTQLVRNDMLRKTMKLSPGWFITNYETLIREDLSTLGWDGIVLDESEKIKDPKTKISKELAGALIEHVTYDDEGRKHIKRIYTDRWRNIKHRVCLTGTPAPENMLNYFQQLKFLFGEFAGTNNYHAFKSKFFESVGPNRFRAKYGFREFLSATLSEQCFVLQRDQVGIGSKKIYEERECELEPELRKTYDEFEKNWMTENQELDVRHALAAFIHLHQMSGGFHHRLATISAHKLNELKKVLKYDLPGEKVVIWFRYNEEIREVAKSLPKDSFRIWTGQTSLYERKHLEELFAYRNRNKQNQIKYLLCQTKSACRGLDFAGADQAIYFSNELGSQYRDQSEDRIIHPDKKVPLLYIDLIAEDTVCPDVRKALQAKIENQQSFLMEIHKSMKKRLGYK